MNSLAGSYIGYLYIDLSLSFSFSLSSELKEIFRSLFVLL